MVPRVWVSRGAVAVWLVIAGACVAGCSGSGSSSCRPAKSSPAITQSVPGTIFGTVVVPVSAAVGDTITISATFARPPRDEPTVTNAAVACIVSTQVRDDRRTIVVYTRKVGTTEVIAVAVNGPANGDQLDMSLTVTG
jgi:hypothetical protein